MELTLVLGILKQGLILWNTKESNKYLDEVIKLENEYYEELAIPEHLRSQLYLDTRLLKLTIIAQSFAKHPKH